MLRVFFFLSCSFFVAIAGRVVVFVSMIDISTPDLFLLCHFVCFYLSVIGNGTHKECCSWKSPQIKTTTHIHPIDA